MDRSTPCAIAPPPLPPRSGGGRYAPSVVLHEGTGHAGMPVLPAASSAPWSVSSPMLALSWLQSGATFLLIRKFPTGVPDPVTGVPSSL